MFRRGNVQNYQPIKKNQKNKEEKAQTATQNIKKILKKQERRKLL